MMGGVHVFVDGLSCGLRGNVYCKCVSACE